MRIITGSAKGAKLETLEGEETRPTPEMVKEAIFSAIQFDLEGRKIFDVYGGSGQLGLEALSRGAATALFCDSNPAAVDIIKRNAQKAKVYDRCRVLRNEAEVLIRQLGGREKFDIIFIDPPYADKAVGITVERLVRAKLLNDGAIIICESDEPDAAAVPDCCRLRRHTKYGRVYISIFDYGEAPEA